MKWETFVQTLAVLIVIGGVVWLTFQYSNNIRSLWSDQSNNTVNIYVDDQAFSVTVADTKEERQRGLSGVSELDDFSGKLFIFPESGRHGIWMKDMNFPLDILWFDNDLRLIHIEKKVQPASYPTIFAPDTAARFVLEVNAGIADTLNVFIGDRLTLPPNIMPQDIAKDLQD